MQDYPNILWIVLDTLREDFSGPIWEVLKKYGFVKYENVIAPAPWTIPSHVSMFTGEYPSIHGVHEPEKAYSDPDEIVYIKSKIKKIHTAHIVQLFSRKLGFTTYLFSANEWVSPAFGFNWFDFAVNISNAPLLDNREKQDLSRLRGNTLGNTIINLIRAKRLRLLYKLGKSYIIQKSPLVTWPMDKGISNLLKLLKETQLTQPFLVFVNLMEVHEPYPTSPPFTKLRIQNLRTNEPIAEEYLRIWRGKYHDEVRYLIKKLQSLFKILLHNNLFKNSLIIITSDHGQLLGEHGRIGHGVFLYDELLRVPLWIKYPEASQGHIKVDQYISLCNLKDAVVRYVQYYPNTEIILGDTAAFSEVYSPGYVGVISNKLERKNIEQLEKHRIAVYHGPYKGIYNADDRVFEYIKSYNDTKVTEDIKNMLLDDVKRFLKQVRLKNTIKNLKLKGKL